MMTRRAWSSAVIRQASATAMIATRAVPALPAINSLPPSPASPATDFADPLPPPARLGSAETAGRSVPLATLRSPGHRLHAYPEVVRTGYEMADHMAGNRTGLPTLGVEHYTESGITRCPSLAFATERQSRANQSGQLLCWLPSHGDRERVTAFFVTGSARRPACQLGRRDTFCRRTIREHYRLDRALTRAQEFPQEFGY